MKNYIYTISSSPLLRFFKRIFIGLKGLLFRRTGFLKLKDADRMMFI